MGFLKDIKDFLINARKENDYIHEKLDKHTYIIITLQEELENLKNTYYKNVGTLTTFSPAEIDKLKKQIEDNSYACEVRHAISIHPEPDKLIDKLKGLDE